jgi:hypothetical protein
MRTPHWSILVASLSFSLVLGCSTGVDTTGSGFLDGGLANHLGDAGGGGFGTIQLDGGTTGGGGFTPGGGSGGGTGSGSGTGICGTDASTGDTTLDTCLNTSCCSSFTACYADSTCLACLAAPSGTGCSSNSLFVAFDTCWGNNCDTSGGTGTGTGTGTAGTCCANQSCFGDTCDDYIDSACCDTLDACLNDTSCYDCLTSTTATGCDSNATFTAFANCVCGGSGASSCSAECGGSSGGGGTGTAGTCCANQSCFGDTCDDYIDSNCCDSLDACLNDSGCYDCLTSTTATGCSSNSAFMTFASCVCDGSGGTNECYTVCNG